jgi:sec-independent protein translocase protein TatA
MFSQIGAGEILLVVLVVVLLFGARKLPELARSIGESARELRKGIADDDDDDGDSGESAASEETPTDTPT